MVPFKTDLRLSQVPIVTYVIIAMCFVVFKLQLDNREEIRRDAVIYCDKIQQSNAEKHHLDYLTLDSETCVSDLSGLHGVDNPKRLYAAFERYNKEHKEYSDKELVDVVAIFQSRLIEFRRTTPSNLDNFVSYDPSTWNPISMMLSAFAHGDWWHIIFNLIFFFAFAPALELLARGAWRFILALILIELSCDIPYSIVSMSADYPIPTLGLSGMVMGMIGLSAYVMPWARIKTFVWVLHFAKVIPVPAKFLALWYVGWDTYDLLSDDEYGGINVLAHVMGGVSGYLSGILLYKKLREENQYELDLEIDYMRAKRQDNFNLANTYKGDMRRLDNLQREEAYKKEKGRFLDQIHKLISVGRDGIAINIILEEYERLNLTTECYEELFLVMKDWRHGRALSCVGRLIIDRYIIEEHSEPALRYLKYCIDIDEDFVIANPIHLVFLVKKCIASNEIRLGYLLVRNAQQRYQGYINAQDCKKLELLCEDV